MLKLGVNIDHVATLREARYRGKEQGEPSPVTAAMEAEKAGANGITAHLREDRRHIQDHDVWQLRKVIKTRMNLEMANSPEMVKLALELKPDIVCLVPERRQEITTEGGLEVAGSVAAIAKTCSVLKNAGIEVSLFIAPEEKQVDAASRTGASFIELHTGAYAESFNTESKRAHELQRLINASNQARSLGLLVNAGHGLNYENLTAFLILPNLVELNIGHSIVSRAMQVGIERAVGQMLALMQSYASSLLGKSRP